MSEILHSLFSAQLWQIANLGAYAINLGVTALLNPGKGESLLSKWFGPLEDNKQVSDAYPVLVTPAGYTFAIWGPIFGLELAFTVLQFVREPNPILAQASPYWCTACVLQAIWGIAFSKRRTGLSALFLSTLTACLFRVHSITSAAPLTMAWALKLPFAMHFSWALAAALINWNVFLKQSKVSATQLTAAAWSSLLITGAVTASVTYSSQDPIISLVAAWALMGIANKEKDPKILECTQDTIDGFNAVSKVLSAASIVIALVQMFNNTKQ